MFATLPRASLPADLSQFSLIRAVRTLADGGQLSGLEAELNGALGRSMPAHRGGRGQALYLPTRAPVAQGDRRDYLSPAGARRAQREAGRTMLDMVRDRLITVSLGATVIDGLTESVPTVSFGPGAVPEWVDGASPMPMDATASADLMEPREVRAYVDIYRQTLRDAGEAAEGEIVRNLADALAAATDQGAIAGSGEGGEPIGVLFNEDVPIIELGPDGGAPHRGDLAEMVYRASGPAGRGSVAFVTSPGGRRKLMLTETSAGSGNVLWQGDRLIDFPAAVAAIPTDLAKGSGTGLTGIVAGDFTQMVIGLWGNAVVLTIDPYSFDRQSIVRVVASVFVNVLVRHPENHWCRAMGVVWD